MAKRSIHNRGFTLIELMIVVAIIGIMVSIAVPSFLRFQCRSKQTEAKEMLKGLFVGEVGYSAEHGTFLSMVDLTSFGGMDTLGVINSKFYSYTDFAPPSQGQFTLQAIDTRGSVIPQGTRDLWTIDDADAKPFNAEDRCLE